MVDHGGDDVAAQLVAGALDKTGLVYLDVVGKRRCRGRAIRFDDGAVKSVPDTARTGLGMDQRRRQGE